MFQTEKEGDRDAETIEDMRGHNAISCDLLYKDDKGRSKAKKEE